MYLHSSLSFGIYLIMASMKACKQDVSASLLYIKFKKIDSRDVQSLYRSSIFWAIRVKTNTLGNECRRGFATLVINVEGKM